MVGNGRHGGTCAVMDHIEGSLRILRLSHETEPEPWTYEISFAPYAAASMLMSAELAKYRFVLL